MSKTMPTTEKGSPEKDWSYPASGDVDIRAPCVSALVESDDMTLSLAPPSAGEVTLTLDASTDDQDQTAAALMDMTPATAAALGRDLILSAAGAVEESRGPRGRDATVEQAVDDLLTELEGFEDD